MTYEYRAPMGRPVSTPPMDFRSNGHCDHAAPGGGKPVRRDDETTPQYASRCAAWRMANDPEYVARWRDRSAMSAKVRKRRVERVASKLNKTETRGTWMTAEQCAKAQSINLTTAHGRARKEGWEVNRSTYPWIFLVPHAAPAIVAPEPQGEWLTYPQLCERVGYGGGHPSQFARKTVERYGFEYRHSDDGRAEVYVPADAVLAQWKPRKLRGGGQMVSAAVIAEPPAPPTFWQRIKSWCGL
jgi:hypothetical protein